MSILFRPDDDVAEFIDTIEPGLKTRTLNEAVRFYIKYKQNKEPLLITRIEDIEKRLTKVEKRIK